MLFASTSSILNSFLMKKTLVLIIFLIIYNNLAAQNNLTIRVNSGVVSEIEIADGSYFSFDIGIPIVKSLELAPTFSYYLVTSNKKEITYHGDLSYSNNFHKGFQYSDTSGIIDLMLIFKPSDLFLDTNSKHDLRLGIGLIGLGYHTQLRSNINNGIVESFSYYQGTYISYLHAKAFYNYNFTNNIFLGVIAGTNVGKYPYFGIQFGINLENKNTDNQ